MSPVAAASLETHLARFKLTSFRPGQREAIAAILDGQDCLCIMPTGGGKSLCYQLPAVARAGMTLVVSPLIALMKDQVDSLTALGIAATYINSSLQPAEALARINQMAAGKFDLVYIAPERLRSTLFLEKVRQTNVQLLAVDEAHCISEWGHDFRPDYARLGTLRQRLGQLQTVALTATATPDVRRDIAAQLQLREPRVFITGFSRPNLKFEVQQAFSEADRQRILTEFLRQTPGAGIVYSATRKGCEELVPLLAKTAGRRVDLYHAGLEADARRRVQDDFMSGQTPVIVATNAFGMGIDKADLRFVIHYNIPGTLEAYYQEAGRAGRDGSPSRCLLLYAQRDRRIQEFFIESAYPEPEIVERVYDFLRAIPKDPIELTLDEIRERLNLPLRSEGIAACEKLLEKCGALERLDARQNMAGVRIDSDLPTLVDLLPREAKSQRRVLQAVERRVAGQRYERVYLNSRQLARAVEMDIVPLNRALRELSKLAAFDYVPPFRGRAVHMLVRDKRFEDLGIDFAEQERHKVAEYAKLDRMIRYATAHGCRQIEILDYFGDPSRHVCDTCDNCELARRNAGARSAGPGKSDHGKQPSASEAAHAGSFRQANDLPTEPSRHVIEAVRIALSGVARMKGRYGKQMVARMLVGSQAKELTKLRLDKLSTFGLLGHLTEPQAGTLIEALLSARLLQQVEETPYRPLVRLTPRGEEVMKGASPLVEPLTLDGLLRARLEAVPNREIAAAAAYAPVTADRVPRPTKTAVIPTGNSDRPPHYWTWRVFAAGFSAAECASIRGINRKSLVEHLLAAARDGHPVELAWVLAPEQLVMLGNRFAETASHGRTAFLAAIAEHVAPAEAELFWLLQPAGTMATELRPN